MGLAGLLLIAFLAALVGWGIAPRVALGRCLSYLGAARPAWKVTIAGLLAFGLGSLGAGIGEIVREVVSTRRLVRALRSRTPPALPRRLGIVLAEHDLGDRVDVVVDRDAYAFSVGFWRPRIMLSTGLLDLLATDELAAVLHHEAYHMKTRDSSKVAVARAAARALFFLPSAKDLADGYRVLKELAADEYAIARLGDRWPLASALSKLARRGQGEVAIGAAAGVAGDITLRIRQLLENPGEVAVPLSRSRGRVLASAIAVALLVGLSVTAIEPISASARPATCPLSLHE